MELFCRLIDRGTFDVHAVSRAHQPTLLQKTKVTLGRIIRNPKALAKHKLWSSFFARQPRFEAALGNNHVHIAANESDLRRILLELKPDILHIHYSGISEPPLTFDEVAQTVPVIVTTNQFEIENRSPNHLYVKRMYFVSQWLLDNRAYWAKNDPRSRVMYNLTDPPEANDNLRIELGIPKDAFVIGRVGRADPGIHDPISLQAVALMQDRRTWFVPLNPPHNMIEEAHTLGIKNFITVPAITDSKRLSRYYNTIDVLAHARKDGETFGCNIAEAMMHGKPVVSHLCDAMNAQIETVADGGSVVAMGDVNAYAKALTHLRDDHAHYRATADHALDRANKAYASGLLVKDLEFDYRALLKEAEIKPSVQK